MKPRYKEAPDKSDFGADSSVIRNKGTDLSFFKSCSLPSRKNSRSFETYLDAWSKSLLAEFNTIIQNGSSSPDAVESAEDDYDEVAADSDDDSSSMRMKYRINDGGGGHQRDEFEMSPLSSPTVSPSTSEHSSSGSSASGGNRGRRTSGYLPRMGRAKQRSHVASVNNKRDPMLVNVKIYPTERPRVPEITRRGDYEFENSHHVSVVHISNVRSKIACSITIGSTLN